MDGVLIHETAVVDPGAEVGEGTRVWHFVHVCAGARIGRDCVLGQNVFVADGVSIGDGVRIQNNVSLYSGVTVEDHAFLGPSCVFTNVVNPRSEISRKHEYRPTRVGRGATVGANATIVCGHHLGEYAFVGAGSVVTRDLPDFALAFGNPARRRGWACRCGERLPLPSRAAPSEGYVTCPACQTGYRIEGARCEMVAK